MAPLRHFNELKNILELKSVEDDLIETNYLEIIKTRKKEYPIVSFVIGSKNKQDPTFGIFGGVHGLERVGTHVVISFLSNLIARLSWDKELRKAFEHFRIVSIPLVNPAGMDQLSRSNPKGVDLMRNAPVECLENSIWPLAGQTYSNHMPWYRGDVQNMELESQAVVNFVKEEMFPAISSMALDVHSGFGTVDRLWYPYAKTRQDFPYKFEAYKIKELLDRTLPHHVYHVEPQSQSYVTSGDLWDYLFDLKYQNPQQAGVFIPWTLELGSWLWVKKNPLQLFSMLGMYNPVKKHRFDRIMRRHLLLIDFLCSIVKNPESWSIKRDLKGA